MEELKNVREKFKDVRNICPEMSGDMYSLTDYIAENMKDNVSLFPEGMMILFGCVLHDIEIEKNDFGYGKEFPQELIDRKNFVKKEFYNLPLVVDKIANKTFAKEFRTLWKKVFNQEAPKEESYNENVRVAVDWWANAIISPKYDCGDSITDTVASICKSSKTFSEEELEMFKNELAEGIIDAMKKDYYGRATICVDYTPCEILSKAGDTVGINKVSGYPFKTSMLISKEQVSVYSGYGSKEKILWEA